MTLPARPDVLVVGGGVIGCATARALARPGRSVLLVERGALGGEATTAAAGVLAVASGDDEGDRLALRAASLACYPALAAELADETGIDVGLERAGVLELCRDPDDVERARARLARRRAQGLAADWLDLATVRRVAPVATTAVGGVLFADDARVSPSRLIEALAAAARRRGAVVVPGAGLQAAESHAGRVVRATVGGDSIAPGVVVVAAGAWSGRLPGIAPAVDIRPVRGQMLALRAPGPVGGPVLMHGDGYLVPQPGSELLVGATMEDAGFVRAVTPAGVATLLGHVQRLAPAAAAWPIVRLWSGLRPDAFGRGPRIGWHPALENVVIAAGHHRNGILLAPVTAAAVAALVDCGVTPAEAVPFGVA